MVWSRNFERRVRIAARFFSRVRRSVSLCTFCSRAVASAASAAASCASSPAIRCGVAATRRRAPSAAVSSCCNSMRWSRSCDISERLVWTSSSDRARIRLDLWRAACGDVDAPTETKKAPHRRSLGVPRCWAWSCAWHGAWGMTVSRSRSLDDGALGPRRSKLHAEETSMQAEAGRECYHCKEWVTAGEAHHCWTTTEAALTRDLPEDLHDAWERLREVGAPLGDQRIYASHNSIMFARRSCYFFVRPKKTFLEVCVFLGRSVNAPQVRRIDRA